MNSRVPHDEKEDKTNKKYENVEENEEKEGSEKWWPNNPSWTIIAQDSCNPSKHVPPTQKTLRGFYFFAP